MNNSRVFYLCSVCFNASERPAVCHHRPMVRCDPGQPGDDRRRPPADAQGRLKSHAPRWFLEAIGSVAPGGTISRAAAA
jgi:hypothetical protein